ncbi:coactosin family protein [Kitasatospora sp. NPDC059571]|uniref:coactosin family protein n=1 Tax=Kitasatospora sp. NPDC059571 TaxID=3346871 RepID=UPI0036C08DF9
MDWATFGYEGNDIVVAGTGTGFESLPGALPDDAPMYAYCRVDIPTEETTRTRFVLISWVGEGTSPMKKGKVSVDKPALKAVIKDVTIEIATSDRDDLTQDKVIQKVRSANY